MCERPISRSHFLILGIGKNMIRDMLKMFIGDILQNLSVQVNKHDLFEQRGERPRSPKLPKTDEVQESILSTSAKAQSTSEEISPSVQIISCQDIKKRQSLPHWKIFVHWATWCEGCIEELPILEDLIQVLDELPQKKDIDIYGISWDNFMFHNIKQAKEEVENFYNNQMIPFPTGILSDTDEEFFSFFSLSQKKIPQVWLIDHKGTRKIFPEGIGLEEIVDIQNDIQKSAL
jgi:thiol-disulfide isomerase/thioredoxin